MLRFHHDILCSLVYFKYMKFIQADKNTAELAIAARLQEELAAGKRVVWLVSGGSNVELEVAIMSTLRGNVGDKLGNLTILPMDERYGDPGHENSNSEFLRQAGFLPGAAEWIDILAHDVSFSETIEYYDDVVSEALALAQVVVGQFGLGADGHVAGILPTSPATEEDYATVVGYEWEDYVRLTLSPRTLSEVNVGYVVAYGDNKEEALKRLQSNQEELETLPAHLLYDIPEVYVYTDNATR